MKKLLLASILVSLVFLLLFCFSFKNQEKTEVAIKWLTIEQAEKLNKEKPKKILIDLYTSWCGYCKLLDSTTFNNPEVISYINENFYAVKFDAERTDTVIFNNDTLVNLGAPFNKRGPHQFTKKYGIVNGQLGYPTIVYIDGTNKKIEAISSYFNARDFMIPLHYISDNYYKTKTFDVYYGEEMTKLESTK